MSHATEWPGFDGLSVPVVQLRTLSTIVTGRKVTV
jgi:hypothetical protein